MIFIVFFIKKCYNGNYFFLRSLINLKKQKQILKEEIKNIKNIIKQNKLNKYESIPYYNQIHYKYGNKAYRHFVPKSIQRRDVVLLRTEGKYLDIYTKYGEKIFHSQRPIIIDNDIQYECGNKLKGLLYHYIYEFRYTFKRMFMPFVASVLLAIPVGTAVASEKEQYNNYKTYHSEIADYENHLKSYSKQIANCNLSDLEIIIKLFNDNWTNTFGYGVPYIDLLGYYGLDMELRSRILQKYG